MITYKSNILLIQLLFYYLQYINEIQNISIIQYLIFIYKINDKRLLNSKKMKIIRLYL
jgi:hypothetical protein